MTRIKKFNICICLSHEVNENLELSYDSYRRLRKAAIIFKENNLDYLVTTGWKYQKYLNGPLSLIMSEYAQNNFNILENQILQLNKAKDTVGEAVFLKDLIHKNNLNVEKIYIITSDWHLKRAKEIFNFVFANLEDPLLIFFETLGDKKEKEKEQLNNSIKQFRKLIKSCKPGDFRCIHKEVITNHPLYNQIEYHSD